MKIKIVILLLFSVFYLAGCSYQEEESQVSTSFVLDKDKKELYSSEIEDVLNNYYWRSDLNSLMFFEENVPERDSANEVFSLSSDSGYELSKFSGKRAVVGTINLLHFNGKVAGLAYFYFVNDKVAGVYYASEYAGKLLCSLKNRNVFLQNVDFKGYETETKLEEKINNFEKNKIKFPQSGFVSLGKSKSGESYVAGIQDEELYVYKYNKGVLSLFKRLTFNNEGCVPISASFYKNALGEDGLSVILGEYERSGEENVENQEGIRYFSEKVAFFDNNMNRTNEQIVLDSPGYSCIGYDDENLILFNDKSVEYFKYINGAWASGSQFFVNHTVTDFHKVDLDGDGVFEYLMTDGLDLYLYHKEESGFVKLWQTHLGVKSLSGSIYSGDLNNDGIKEVYICDQTGTSIRYVLTKKGFVSKNDDIEYGEKYFPGDFDLDGKDDFIKINDIENSEEYLYVQSN